LEPKIFSNKQLDCNPKNCCYTRVYGKCPRPMSIGINVQCSKPQKLRIESNPMNVKRNRPGKKKLENPEFFKKSRLICNNEPSGLSISNNPPREAFKPSNKCKKHSR
jgi:hypothetical protein